MPLNEFTVCFYSLGIYTLLAMDMLFEGFSLKEMKAIGHVTETTNVDRSVGITATFEGNRIAQLLCSGGILSVQIVCTF